jgi:uncharacterized protein (DUF488 family)
VQELVTIGYEGATIDDFIETLRIAKIEQLVDVREIPNSRKKGFSKNGLSAALADVGIDYVHLPALGDPKPGRDAARAGDYKQFRKIFHNHLKTRKARDALSEAASIVSETRCCLLCFERAPQLCHRSIVAKKLSTISPLNILHIGVQHGSSTDGGTRRQRNSLNIGESATAG